MEYVTAKNAPVDDLQVYFCPNGTAEAAGTLSVAGIKSKVVAQGTLDLSGEKPRIQIDEIRAGNLPSAVAKPAIELVLNTGNLRTLDLGAPIKSITYSDGRVTITSR